MGMMLMFMVKMCVFHRLALVPETATKRKLGASA